MCIVSTKLLAQLWEQNIYPKSTLFFLYGACIMPRNVTLTQFKRFEMLIFSIILCESSKLRIRLVREFSREIDLTNTYFLHMNAMVLP